MADGTAGHAPGQHEQAKPNLLPDVTHILAISSGKGGFACRKLLVSDDNLLFTGVADDQVIMKSIALGWPDTW